MECFRRRLLFRLGKKLYFKFPLTVSCVHFTTRNMRTGSIPRDVQDVNNESLTGQEEHIGFCCDDDDSDSEDKVDGEDEVDKEDEVQEGDEEGASDEEDASDDE
ncbi:hypothetical protein Tco_0892577 [Tanacetum coccineum]|uniref:Uncharacterized protein n=1 Tax=Tanacetum coccineum TaxID=301880 RepID=A0ABQ5C6L8_9ASTR